MLQAYIRGALGRAHYEILEDDGSYYGEIPDFDGVYANARRWRSAARNSKRSLRNGSCFESHGTWRFRP
jgi:hypothetical protein